MSVAVPSHLRARAVLVAGALMIVYLVWGSTYAALRVMVESVPPWIGGGSRFVVAGVLVLAGLRLAGGPGRLALRRAELASCAVLGVLLVTMANGLITVAERDAASAPVALVAASIPLWVVVLGRLAGARVPRRTGLAVVAGLGGVALLLLPGGEAGAEPLALATAGVAALCWATAIHAGRRLRPPADTLLAAAVQMAIGGAVSLSVGLVTGEAGDLRPGEVTGASAASWAYLVLAGSIVAFSAYAWLLREVPPQTVATHAYVNPVVAVALGALLLGEPVGPAVLAAAAVIVVAVAVTVAPARGPR